MLPHTLDWATCCVILASTTHLLVPITQHQKVPRRHDVPASHFLANSVGGARSPEADTFYDPISRGAWNRVL